MKVVTFGLVLVLLAVSAFGQNADSVFELRIDGQFDASDETNLKWYGLIRRHLQNDPGLFHANPANVVKWSEVESEHRTLEVLMVFAKSQEQDGLKAERYRARMDELLAEHVPPVLEQLGPEGRLILVQRNNLEKLKTSSQLRGFQDDPTFLADPRLRDKLGVTDAQYEPINQGLLEARKKVFEEYFAQFETTGEEHLERLLEVLTGRQRTRFKNLFGQPLEWERLTATNHLRDQTLADLLMKNAKNVGELCPRDGSVSQEMLATFESADQYEQEGIEVIDFFLFSFLRSPLCQREMELSGKQISQLRQLENDWRENALITARFRDERLIELLNGQATYPDAMKSILLTHQLSWLASIELQLYTSDYRSSFGLLHPAVVKEFGIGREQQRELQELAKRYQRAFQALSVGLNADLSQALRAIYGDSLEILTAAQKRRYGLITGVPVN